MKKVKWLLMLSIPVIVLSLCMTSSVQIMSSAEFPVTVLQGNRKYLEGITIETTLFQRKGAVLIDLIGENISYSYEKGLYQTEQYPPSFHASVVKSSIKGRKELTKNECQYISSFYSSSIEKVISCYELEQATFEYSWFNDFSTKENETFTLKTTKNMRLIEQKVQYLYDDESEQIDEIGENYYLYVNDGAYESIIPINYSEDYLTKSDGNYLITTRLESMVTSSRLYYIDFNNKNKEKIMKIAEFSKDRYPFIIKEMNGQAVVLSQDKNKNNYISFYKKDGKLINEKSLQLNMNNIYGYKNVYMNDKYLILEDEDKVHVIDCELMKTVKSYSVDSSSYIYDLYYKDGLLYLIANVGITSSVNIKVLSEKEIVFEGDLVLASYKKFVRDNFINNKGDYYPSIYYHVEVKR